MKSVHNIKTFYDRRKALRNNSTSQEILLWLKLKDSQLGFKFRRQHSIGPYVLDFYSPRSKLAIEIDGFQHIDNREYDKERSEYLSILGIKVVRFWNNEINDNMEGVIQKIISELNSPSHC